MPLTLFACRWRRGSLRATFGPAAAFAAILSLAGCLPGAGGPPAMLARLNPLAADPSQLRAAVRLPETVRVIDPELTVSVALAGVAEPEVRHFPLAVSDDMVDRLAIAPEAKPGFNVTVLRLDDEQATALAAWRAQITTSHHGRLTLSVITDACRTSGPEPASVSMTTYVALTPTAGFHTLTAETDLVEIARELGRPFALKACPAGT